MGEKSKSVSPSRHPPLWDTCSIGISHIHHTQTPIQSNMTIQVNTDRNIESTENMETYVTEKIESGFTHFAEKITRVEVHITDQNAEKGGVDDIQCKIEARVQGLQPVLVESKNDTMHKALSDAINKMQAALRTVFGKMQEKHPNK
jgi:ribosomal subunit interface protein